MWLESNDVTGDVHKPLSVYLHALITLIIYIYNIQDVVFDCPTLLCGAINTAPVFSMQWL